MVATTDNLAFLPHPIEAVGLRAGKGPAVQVQKAIVQRTTALRAYNTFSSDRDWMEKLSSAYVVALATRSAADSKLYRRGSRNALREVSKDNLEH